MSTLLKALSRSDGNKKAMEPQAEGKADGLGPLPDPSPRSKFLRRRQGAINQESVVTGPGSTPYTRAVLPKSEAELSAIFAAFADKPLFAKLAHEQLVQVASIMGKASFKKGDALMREGERGDTFFILQAGTCAVTMGRRQVRNLKEGDGFGEIALIYNQPRTATVTATSDCEVFLMNRAAYRNEVVESIKNQRRQYEQFLSSVPLFASMKPSQRAKVADALRTKSYEPGQQVRVASCCRWTHHCRHPILRHTPAALRSVAATLPQRHSDTASMQKTGRDPVAPAFPRAACRQLRHRLLVDRRT